MSLFGFFSSKCGICNRKIKPLKQYVKDDGNTIKVCLACSEYAERRAFRRKR